MGNKSKSLTLRYHIIKGKHFVVASDVLQALETYPYNRVVNTLRAILNQQEKASATSEESPVIPQVEAPQTPPAAVSPAEPDVPFKPSMDDRLAMWTNSTCQAILRSVCLPDDRDAEGSHKTPAEAIVLDLILSAFLQRNLTGVVDFVNPVIKRTPPDPEVVRTRSVQIDLEAIAKHIYAGPYHPNTSESRTRWIKAVKKHASALVKYGLLAHTSPKEGEAGHILVAELAPRISSKLYADQGKWDTSTPAWIDYLPAHMVKFGRGYTRQYPASYTCPRLLYTHLGVAGAKDRGSITYPKKMSYDELSAVTGQVSYLDWCLQNPSRADPVSYMVDVIYPSFSFIPFKIKEIEETTDVEVTPCMNVVTDLL